MTLKQIPQYVTHQTLLNKVRHASQKNKKGVEACCKPKRWFENYKQSTDSVVYAWGCAEKYIPHLLRVTESDMAAGERRSSQDSWTEWSQQTAWDAAGAADFSRQLVIGSFARQSRQRERHRGSTLGMHAELRGVVYLTPSTSELSTSPKLLKTQLLLPGSFRCHRRRVEVCEHKQVDVWLLRWSATFFFFKKRGTVSFHFLDCCYITAPKGQYPAHLLPSHGVWRDWLPPTATHKPPETSRFLHLTWKPQP